MKNIIVVSGGLDSVTLMHELFMNDLDNRKWKAVTFDYGSKHNKQEQTMAKYHCDKLGIEHIVIEMNFISKYFKSNLLKDGGEIPEGHYAHENMKKTVVPFRNGIMLSIAAGLAESEESDYIYIGSHFGDHAIYPDCRASFVKPMKKAILEGTYNKPRLMAPYSMLTKREIAFKAHKMNYEYEKTYSCYKGGEIQCGRCSTCFERREAFFLAGIKDRSFYLDQTPIQDLMKEYNHGIVPFNKSL